MITGPMLPAPPWLLILPNVPLMFLVTDPNRVGVLSMRLSVPTHGSLQTGAPLTGAFPQNLPKPGRLSARASARLKFLTRVSLVSAKLYRSYVVGYVCTVFYAAERGDRGTGYRAILPCTIGCFVIYWQATALLMAVYRLDIGSTFRLPVSWSVPTFRTMSGLSEVVTNSCGRPIGLTCSELKAIAPGSSSLLTALTTCVQLSCLVLAGR